jgi:hypothetical protein
MKMIQGSWGIRVDTKDWPCLVNWTGDPLPMVVANLSPPGQGPRMYTPEEAWKIGQALCTAAAHAMEGVSPEEAVGAA